MAPPPATPTPHRFLVPKRSAAQSRNETPRAQDNGSRQFQATPRFSLHSTPRNSAVSNPSSTPAATGGFPKPRNTDPISDNLDSSPPVVGSADEDFEPIEVDVVPESSPIGDPENDWEPDDGTVAPDLPPVKRRRLSVSSGPSDLNYQRSTSQDALCEVDNGAQPVSDDDLSQPWVTTAQSPGRETPALQPTFQRAPRFKPIEAAETGRHREPLPDIFSPHRKGTKYIPDGLAAGLREWLVEIEASTGAKRNDEWIARLSVQSVRRSPDMMLVEGLHLQDDSQEGGLRSDYRVRAILAGDGRVTGLNRPSEVSPGATIGIAKPVWKVQLEHGHEWTVVCDWAIL